MAKPVKEINCPIFLKREWTIKELTRDINEAKSVSDKVERAMHLKNEVKMLLSCEKYDKKMGIVKIAKLYLHCVDKRQNFC